MNCNNKKELKPFSMKNILIFAGIAGLAAAVAIYFVTESDKNTFIDDEEGFITDADIATYDLRENTGPATPVNDGLRPA